MTNEITPLALQTTVAVLNRRASFFRQGAAAFATNGRKDGEGASAGTGVPVWFNETDRTWRTYTTGAEVTT